MRSKKRREIDATVVCIDQTEKSVQAEPRAGWFGRGTQPSVKLSGQQDWTCLLGVITESSNRFFSRPTEYITADHAKQFILALYEETENDLIIVVGGAPHFQSAVTDLAARDDLVLVTLPSYSPELSQSRNAGYSSKQPSATDSSTHSTG